MKNRIVKNDEAIATAIEKLTNLMAEIDEIDITSNKLHGDMGEVHSAIVEGEADLEKLKTEMKGLFQVTINFINGFATALDQSDEQSKREIQAL